MSNNEAIKIEIEKIVNGIINSARLQGRYNLRKRIEYAENFDRFQALEDECSEKLENNLKKLHEILETI